MEPIPEDEGNNSTEDGAQHSTESKSVRREIYRSEKVESSKRFFSCRFRRLFFAVVCDLRYSLVFFRCYTHFFALLDDFLRS